MTHFYVIIVVSSVSSSSNAGDITDIATEGYNTMTKYRSKVLFEFIFGLLTDICNRYPDVSVISSKPPVIHTVISIINTLAL